MGEERAARCSHRHRERPGPVPIEMNVKEISERPLVCRQNPRFHVNAPDTRELYEFQADSSDSSAIFACQSWAEWNTYRTRTCSCLILYTAT